MTLTLVAQQRAERGSKACTTLRALGRIPAVMYGAGREPQSLSVSARDFEKVWHVAGESSIVSIEGVGAAQNALIHDVTLDPVYGTPLHADFYAVRADQTVTVSVPLVFSGSAPAERELGGTLVKVLHELEIEALPKDLPHELTVDVSSLATFDDQLRVKDIVLPTGVSACVDADEVVALVQEVVEQTEESAAPVDLSTIEVEKKGKEESDEAEA